MSHQAASGRYDPISYRRSERGERLLPAVSLGLRQNSGDDCGMWPGFYGRWGPRMERLDLTADGLAGIDRHAREPDINFSAAASA